MVRLDSYKQVLLATTRRDLVIMEASGFYLTVNDSKKTIANVIDGTSQVGVCPLGHRNQELMEYIREYYSENDSRPIMLAGQDYYHPYQKELAQKLTKLFPGKNKLGDIKVYYCNSGSEAVEKGCLKVAEHYKQGHTMLAFQNAFHGRTSLALSANFSKGIHKEGFHFLSRTIPLPFPAQSASILSSKGKDLVGDCTRYLEKTILQEGAQNINCVIIEPIQGEGGYIVPHDDFMPALREICTAHNIPLVCDEVQSSLRTGKWFASEHFKIQPDMISVAKAFSGGISAFGASMVKSSFVDGKLGRFAGTFGGSPKDCFMALKTIEIIEKNKYLQNAQKQGNKLMRNLKKLERYNIIREVRGKGLMIGIEFEKRGKPDPVTRNKVLHHLLYDYKILTEGCGNDQLNPSIRFLLPLNVTSEVIDQIIFGLNESIKKFGKNR